MSLLRLLTAGKSLVGVRDADSRYRLTNQRLLPQFGPARNPFSYSREIETAPTEAMLPVDDGGNGAAREEGLKANGIETTPAMVRSVAQGHGAPTIARGHQLAEALRLRAAALLSGCKAKLAAILGRVQVKAAKPAIPRFTKAPVQGELSLDKIKVVRNDLSDADLEVVPARMPATPPNSGTALPGEAGRGVEASRWRKVATGLFSVGKT
jgi:hypothetical protein